MCSFVRLASFTCIILLKLLHVVACGFVLHFLLLLRNNLLSEYTTSYLSIHQLNYELL